MSNTHTPSAADVSKEQLVRDFKVLVADAEALLKATAGQSGETLGARAYEDGRGTLPRPWSDELDRRILRVLLPCSLSFLVVPLTNAVDAAWIGRMGDALALAGQGAANQVFSTAFFLISFLPTVMAPLVARAVGKSDEDDARARIGETLFLATFFGVLGSIALAVYPGVCMRIVLPDDAAALAHANSYLWVRSLSLLPALWGSVGFCFRIPHSSARGRFGGAGSGLQHSDVVVGFGRCVALGTPG